MMRRAASLAVVVASLTASMETRADDKIDCVNAAERAQQLRDEHRLVAAMREAIACGRDQCPRVVRADCTDLVEALRRRTPTAIVRVRSRGQDRLDARLSIDGAAAEITGGAVTLEPGRHVTRAEIPGAPPVEQVILMVEGERDRVVEVGLDEGASSAAAPRDPAAPPNERPDEKRPAPSAVPTGAWYAGGVGVVGFVYFGLKARSDIDYLRSTCAPRCTDEQISYANAKRIAADVSLGVGLIGLGVATWLVLRAPGTSATNVQIGWSAARGGGLTTVSGAL